MRLTNKFLMTLLMVLYAAVTHAASLIGDTVNTRYQVLPGAYDVSDSYVVGSGVEDTSWAGTSYWIDFGATTISIGSNIGEGQTSYNNVKWTFSSLDLGSPITGVSLATNWTNINQSWLSFGSNWVAINFLTSVSYVSPNDYLTLTLESSPVSAVPLPPAAFLFAPALLGFMGLRRKSKLAAAA